MSKKEKRKKESDKSWRRYSNRKDHGLLACSRCINADHESMFIS